MHGTEHCLSAGSMLQETPDTLPLSELADFASRMVPGNCLIERCGQVAWEEMEELEGNMSRGGAAAVVEKRKERWYGIDYYLSKIDETDVKRWLGSNGVEPFLKATELALPAPNTYIPENLELCPDLPDEAKEGPRIEKEITPPNLVVDDTTVGRLWHRLDDRYALPKSSLTLLIRTAAVEHVKVNGGSWQYSADASVHSSLLAAMFAEALAQETYDADLAGLGWGLSLSTAGIRVGCSGFSDRLPDLTVKILEEFLVDGFLQESYFQSAKDRMLRSLRTYFESRRADSHSIYYRDFLLASVDQGIDAAIESVQAASLDSVKAHHKAILNNEEALIDCLFTGNVSESEARKFFATASQKIADASALVGTAATPGMWIPGNLERRLKPGHSVELHFASKNEQEENGSAMITYQSPVPGFRGEGLSTEESLQSSSAIRLLCHILREPLFDELRTKQTLGYIVSSYYDIGWSSLPPPPSAGPEDMDKTPWTVPVDFVVISVLSRKVAPPEVVQRIENFLVEFRQSLANMPESEIADHASALSTKLLKPIQKLSTEASTHFTKIRRFAPEIHASSDEIDLPWDNSKVIASTIRSLRRKDLLRQWDRMMLPHTSARVVSCVYGTTFPLRRDNLLSSSPLRTVIVDRMADIVQLRRHLSVFDNTVSLPQPGMKTLSLLRWFPTGTAPSGIVVTAAALVGAGAVLAAGWAVMDRSRKVAVK